MNQEELKNFSLTIASAVFSGIENMGAAILFQKGDEGITFGTKEILQTLDLEKLADLLIDQGWSDKEIEDLFHKMYSDPRTNDG